MKWVVRLPLVMVISVAFALVLSQIPHLQSGPYASVFSQEKKITLVESNVVDVLQQLPLYLRIHKVEVSPTMLSVDLLLEDRSLARSAIFHDLYEMPRYFFSKTDNIAQIFIRVLEPGTAGKRSGTLLVAVGARREQATAGRSESARIAEENRERYVRSHYRLIETVRWNEMRLQ